MHMCPSGRRKRSAKSFITVGSNPTMCSNLICGNGIEVVPLPSKQKIKVGSSPSYRSNFLCGSNIMANVLVFQTRDEGSIPSYHTKFYARAV